MLANAGRRCQARAHASRAHNHSRRRFGEKRPIQCRMEAAHPAPDEAFEIVRHGAEAGWKLRGVPKVSPSACPAGVYGREAALQAHPSLRRRPTDFCCRPCGRGG